MRHHDQKLHKVVSFIVLLLNAKCHSFSALSSSAYRQRATTFLSMVQYRGLEVKRDGATPTEGGMTLYLKAGPPSDGSNTLPVGDCPFAHFVRMVLEEKNLPYMVQPCTAETKPSWLLEYYQGKMPALRHRKECYVESTVIAEYLDFFFPNPALKVANEAAEQAIDGFFPALAKYLKHTTTDDDEDKQLKEALETKLEQLENYLTGRQSGPYLTGEQVSMLDCRFAPQLYHMKVGVPAFKADPLKEFPAVQAYMDAIFARDSFQKTVYPPEIVEWGWGNARK